MTITRNDVAKLAGVSTATVSYVVNNGPRPVAEETRQKVLRAIQVLGYHPSAIARSLKTNITCTVGIIIPDIVNPLVALLAQTIEDELLSADYNLIICNSKESHERERAYLQMLVSKQVDGIIMTPSGGNHDMLVSMAKSGKRIVLIDRKVKGLDTDCVLFDNEGGAHAGVQHLISLGHSRIGMINLPPWLTPGAGRLKGYERALHDAGLSVDPLLIESGTHTAEEAFSLAEEMLSLDNPPTAMFVSSNRLARGVLRFVKEHGLRMPDDLALCVFDDIDYYAYITPSITAIGHDYRQFGREAVRLLMENIKRKDAHEPQIVTLPYQLHVRESTVGLKAPCGQADPLTITRAVHTDS